MVSNPSRHLTTSPLFPQVVDLKRFTPGHELQPGLLTVLEMLPGGGHGPRVLGVMKGRQQVGAPPTGVKV